jgi:hypothetical protein
VSDAFLFEPFGELVAVILSSAIGA